MLIRRNDRKHLFRGRARVRAEKQKVKLRRFQYAPCLKNFGRQALTYRVRMQRIFLPAHEDQEAALSPRLFVEPSDAALVLTSGRFRIDIPVFVRDEVVREREVDVRVGCLDRSLFGVVDAVHTDNHALGMEEIRKTGFEKVEPHEEIAVRNPVQGQANLR